MPAKQRTTGEALAEARQMIGQARVNDPNEHFPYKAKDVAALLKSNPQMDPGDGSDVHAEDFMTKRIAEASEAYIAAQQALVLDPSDANRSAYNAAGEDLVAARKTHRRNRVDVDGNPAGAVAATSNTLPPAHQRGPRARRVGEA